MFGVAISSIAVKLALGVATVTVATGSLAATGNLPDPVQEAVAGVAGNIGIDLPNPNQEVDGPDVDAGAEAEKRIAKVQRSANTYAITAKAWADCVSANAHAIGAAAQQAVQNGAAPAPSDPTAGCGERPQPPSVDVSTPSEVQQKINEATAHADAAKAQADGVVQQVTQLADKHAGRTQGHVDGVTQHGQDAATDAQNVVGNNTPAVETPGTPQAPSAPSAPQLPSTPDLPLDTPDVPNLGL